ncbi:hypothetical protein K1719_017128 [Acacia pycnantha]|nr:hypothetical protein K1719_017128 [Acacia pycnantha]
MGTKNNLSLLKTHFDSIKSCFVNHSVPGSMLWVFTSLRVFICNYVLYSFGLILQFIFRIAKADGKNELFAQPEEDSQIDGFREDLINFLFPSNEYVNEGSEEREMKNSALMESFNDFAEDDNIKESGDEETESSVSEKSREEEEEDEGYFSASMNEEGEKDFEDTTKNDSELYDGGVKNEKEGAQSSVLMEDEEEKNETGKSSSVEGEEIEREEEDDETESSALITNKFEYVSRSDVIAFVEEPTTTMTFSFREFFVGPYVSDTEISEYKSEKEKSDRAQGFGEFYPCPNGSQIEIPELKSENELVFQKEALEEISELKPEEEKSIGAESFPEFHPSPSGSEVEISELKSEQEPIFLEESPKKQSMPSFHSSPNVSETGISETKSEEEKEGSIQEERMFHGHSSSDQFSLKSEIFNGRDSSDEDDLDFNDNSFESDSESESSSSSGLIWGNSDKTDDLITFEFLAYQKGFEGLEPETLKLMEKLRAIDEFIELAPGKAENEDENKGSKDEQKKLGELVSEEDDDDFEWDDDELVEQMKMEMRNARQGGLPTILEDEEEQEDSKSPKLVEDLKPLKIEEKLEFKDHIREIQKVHKCYEEKMRKLDILNYQTMHSLGLRQLKEPSVKPMILKNLLRSTKDQKKKSEASLLVGLVVELEVVYVGQLCLSWEILCWEYKKAIELKQYDAQWVRRYNVVAGEFQLFQVLMQRFIENEPFQGPRLHNYVRNRCVIRNLLQVPTIQDDSMRDKNMMTKDEDDTVSSERLAEIIRESMYIFSNFARADKHDINGSTCFRLPQTKPTHLKDPATSHLFTDIQTHLLKKEKRLKDIVRSGNCIVRKFQKQNKHKVELDLEQMVAQVQLKLISRVLSMSKLRKDQLIWCNDKLKKITFVDTKVRVEPSFLLFPF